MTEVTFDKNLAPLKEAAKREVDQGAERERQRRWITPGDGQAQEYVITREEAFAIQNDSDPSSVDYPQLAAERDAQNEATGANKTLSDVATEVRAIVMAQNNGDGAAIKKARRKAKIQIDRAQNPAEIEQAAQIDWQHI